MTFRESVTSFLKEFGRKLYLRVFGLPLLVIFLGIQLARKIATKWSGKAEEEKPHD